MSITSLTHPFVHRVRQLTSLTLMAVLLLGTDLAPVPTSNSGLESTTRYTYNARGQVLGRTDAMGQITQYAYDAGGRLVSIRYADGSTVTYAYDALNRRTQMTDAVGTTRYEYDEHSRLIQISDALGHTVRYAYDERGLPARLTYPDGSAITYTWDAGGHLVAIADPSGVMRFDDDRSGRVARRTLPNGVQTEYTYDAANRLKTIRHTGPGGAALLAFEYAYDAAGNRTQVIRIESGGSPQATRYAYDGRSQLIRVDYPDGEQVTYEYDAIGNRTQMTSTRTGVTRYTYRLDQLVAVSGPEGEERFRYDADGRLTDRTGARRTVHYTWDAAGQLAGVDVGATAIRFRYDGDGRRLSKTVDGQTTEYILDALLVPHPLAEITAGQTTRAALGQSGIGQTDGSGTRFYLEDGLGSVVGVTDASGKLIQAITYDAFGAVRAGVPPDSAGFAGEGYDAETGLVFLRARSYDPSTGRFIGPDPAAGLLADPRTLERYTYVSNDPVNLVDPSGLDWWDWWNRISQGGWWDYGYSMGSESFSARTGEIRRSLLPLPGACIYVCAGDMPGRYDVASEISLGLGEYPGVTMGTWGPDEQHYFQLNLGISVVPLPVSINGNEFGGWQGSQSWHKPFPPSIIRAPQEGEFSTPVLRAPEPGEGSWSSAEPSLRHDDGGGNWLLPAFDGGIGPGDGISLGTEEDPVGGVTLDRAAQVLVDLGDLIGATYDRQTGQVVLILRTARENSLPPMNPDDLAVAVRAVYAGPSPGVTMVPVDPSGQDHTQRVEYFGGTQNTHFGAVMFEADRTLKSLAAGQDTLTGQPLDPQVPGFRSELDLSLDLRTDTPWHRTWFVPGDIVVKQAADGRSMVFDQASIRAESRFIRFLPDGSPQDVAGSSPVTDQFTRFLTAHYDQFAAAKPELAELIQLAKITGLVRWLRDNRIPLDLSWLGQYPIRAVETPRTTPGVVAEKRTADSTYGIRTFGGVDFSTANTYAPDDAGRAAGLAEAALTSRPAAAPIRWDFQQAGQAYTGVALTLSPAPIHGGFTTSRTDLSIPVGGGLQAIFARSYNSLDLTPWALGPGWSFIPYALHIQDVHRQLDDGSYTIEPQVSLQVGSQRLGFTGPYQASDRPGEEFLLPERPSDLYRDIRRAADGYVLRRTDGLNILLDGEGRLQAMEDGAGDRVEYRYDTMGRVVAIAGKDNRGLQLHYGAAGRLDDVTASDGRQTRYHYDPAGHLIDVADQTGQMQVGYAYDETGRLVRLLDGSGQVAAELAYDDLGRVTHSRYGRYEYSSTGNEVAYIDTAGDRFTRRYDEHNRLVEAIDPSGHTASYEYDPDGRLVQWTDGDGSTRRYRYDADGHLIEQIDPLGQRMRWLHYNAFGQPEAMIDAADRLSLYHFDDQGRLTGMQTGLRLVTLSADGDLHYEPAEPATLEFEFQPAGQLAQVVAPGGLTTRFGYDPLGRLVQIQFPDGSQVTRTFDDRGQVVSATGPAGSPIEFGYNAQGQLATVTTPARVTQVAYIAGRITAVTDALNHTTRYEFEPGGHLRQVVEPDGASTRYTYDSEGRLEAIRDALGLQVTYQYDALGRLVAETRPATPMQELGADSSPAIAPSRAPESAPPAKAEGTLEPAKVAAVFLGLLVVAVAGLRLRAGRDRQDSDWVDRDRYS